VCQCQSRSNTAASSDFRKAEVWPNGPLDGSIFACDGIRSVEWNRRVPPREVFSTSPGEGVGKPFDRSEDPGQLGGVFVTEGETGAMCGGLNGSLRMRLDSQPNRYRPPGGSVGDRGAAWGAGGVRFLRPAHLRVDAPGALRGADRPLGGRFSLDLSGWPRSGGWRRTRDWASPDERR
jgi:hypothetical protein